MYSIQPPTRLPEAAAENGNPFGSGSPAEHIASSFPNPPARVHFLLKTSSFPLLDAEVL